MEYGRLLQSFAMSFLDKVEVKIYQIQDHTPEDFGVDFDLLLLPGGPDYSLALQEHMVDFPFGQGKDCPTYTYFYKHKFACWATAGVPMFGICLGFQALCAKLGNKIVHHMYGHQSAEMHAHTIKYGNAPHKVNSRHHQCVLSLGFKGGSVVATSEGGLIAEAMVSDDNMFAGVQWHPEDMRNLLRNGDSITFTLMKKIINVKRHKKGQELL